MEDKRKRKSNFVNQLKTQRDSRSEIWIFRFSRSGDGPRCFGHSLEFRGPRERLQPTSRGGTETARTGPIPELRRGKAREIPFFYTKVIGKRWERKRRKFRHSENVLGRWQYFFPPFKSERAKETVDGSEKKNTKKGNLLSSNGLA